MDEFDDYISMEKWDKRFKVPFAVFLEMSVDPNLRLFMGMHLNSDLIKGEENDIEKDFSKINKF
jgi:hypothetical protein